MSSNRDGTLESGGCFKMRSVEYHDYKTILGSCFVSFSLPLLIPGITLTVIGSRGNENLIPLFGGWHITGIVILSFAVIMLIFGILFKCYFKPIPGSDIETYLTPTPSMIGGHRNLGYIKDNTGSSPMLNNKVGHHDEPHKVVSIHDKKDINGEVHSLEDTVTTNGQRIQSHSLDVKPNAPYCSNNTHTSFTATNCSTTQTDELDRTRSERPPEVSNVSFSVTRARQKNKHKGLQSIAVADRKTTSSGVETTNKVRSSTTTTVKANFETRKPNKLDHKDDTADNSSVITKTVGRSRKKKKRHSIKTSVNNGFRVELDEARMVRPRVELPSLRGVPQTLQENGKPGLETCTMSMLEK